jgi:hypothetical protein
MLLWITHRLSDGSPAPAALVPIDQRRSPMSQVESSHPWRTLYRIAAVGAALTAILIPVQVVVYLIWPPPATAAGHFALMQENWLVGLLALDLLLLIDNAFLIPILLALYIALRRSSESLMALATVAGFIGLACYFSSNTIVELFALARQHAVAATAAEADQLLAAGHALLAIYTGTAFHVSYALGSVVLIVISAVMLHGNVFSRITGYLGVVANVIALGLYVPGVGIYLSVFSVLFLEVWYILIAARFARL